MLLLWRLHLIVGAQLIFCKFYNIEQLEEVWDNGKVQARYSYYSDGKIKQVQGENLNTYYAYDEDRNLIGLETKLGTESIVNNTYKYDKYGNCIEKEMIQGIHKYEYDSEDRLTKATYPTYTEEYTYDKVGNRKKRILREVKTEVEKPRPNINASASGYTYNPRTSTQTPNEARQRMEKVSQTAIELNKKTGLYEQIEMYHYNTNNQLIKKTAYTSEGQTKDINHYIYDVNGNLVEEKGVKNTYNVFNQLETVTKADGTYQKNTYDAEELRYQTEENHKLVQYIYNEDREIITELTKQGAKRYVRGHELITSECYRTRNYYHYASDERGSITHVLEEGQIKNFYEYDVFGNISYEREEVENHFKYTGEKLDQVTNQYYLRARYYNPVIGRFTQQDTYHGAGLNLYSYVANNPLKYVDPSGHTKCSVETSISDKLGKNANDITVNPDGSLKRGPLKMNLQFFTNNTSNGNLGNKRLIPGKPGVVTGGSSTKLGKNLMESMDLPRSTKWSGYQAQHIIPKEHKTHPVIKKIGMDMDDASNGIFLRNRKSGGVSSKSRHEGFHAQYNDVVAEKLDAIDLSKNVDIIEKEVYELQQSCRKIVENGDPIYLKDHEPLGKFGKKINKKLGTKEGDKIKEFLRKRLK